MVFSGAETRQLFTREERREVGWLTVVGTGIPFVLALLLGPWLIHPALAGPSGNRTSLIIILAVGVAGNVRSRSFENICRFKNTSHSLCPIGTWGRGVGGHRAVAGAGDRHGDCGEDRA
jgi:hypothetical protein